MSDSPLTHFDAAGQAHMVDVGAKAETARLARATGRIRMQPTTFENPMGINGFEFVEFAAPADRGEAMAQYLRNLGFTAVAKHKSRPITLYRQGTINFLLNESPDSFASGAEPSSISK